DIWLCVDKTLSKAKRQLLREKCHLIEIWAASYHVDLCFFIVDEDRFQDQHWDKLEGENCGSSQHILLLEEFYRTATTLAGKPLLWYIIRTDNDADDKAYKQKITALCQEGIIVREQWVDFGP